MTLDEAIRILRQHNQTGASVMRITKGRATEMELLAQVLNRCEQNEVELKEAKRLLKLAVDDANSEAESLCAFCKHNDLVDGCPYIESYSECEYIWRYTDEALKLIEGDTNG